MPGAVRRAAGQQAYRPGRPLAARPRGRHYTIGSSGHEGNAAVAAALRLTDPALLHYRSGAFYLVRAAQASPPRDGVPDVLLGLAAAAAEPIAGGRHKVFGHPELHVIPQTSTIASHLPRAVGLAFSLARAAKLGLATPWPQDAVVVTSFGDASVNHSTAAGALNTASYCAYQGLPMPLLLVCEDNGIGISVRTPAGWVEAAAGSRPKIRYFSADGTDLAAVYDAATEAASWARERRAPAFLHLRMVRLGGHAGSDVESAYRTPEEIAADEARDPLLRTASLLRRSGALTPAEALDRYEAARARVLALAGEIARRAQARERQPGHGADRTAAARHRGREPGRPGPAVRHLAAAPGLRLPAARGRGPADPGPGHQPHADRRAGRAGDDRLRRGRRPQGRRVRGDPRAHARLRSRPRF